MASSSSPSHLTLFSSRFRTRSRRSSRRDSALVHSLKEFRRSLTAWRISSSLVYARSWRLTTRSRRVFLAAAESFPLGRSWSVANTASFTWRDCSKVTVTCHRSSGNRGSGSVPTSGPVAVGVSTGAGFMGEALGSSDLFPGLGARIVDSKGAACDDSAWTAAGLSSGSSVLFPGLGARIVDSKGAAGDDSAWTAAGLSSGGSVSNEASEPGDARGGVH